MTKPIKSIPEYIEKIQNLVNAEKQEHALVMFRGESKVYPTPCQPNIFRKDLYRKDKFFEKNLFDEMRANHLTDGQSYLENAIDAQHDGFPSRLLDVTLDKKGNMLKKHILEFAQLVAKNTRVFMQDSSNHQTILGSNDFKKEEIYTKWC